MKRSEMVKVMQNNLDFDLIHDIFYLEDEYHIEKLCDQLLRCLEEAGMLPPPKRIDVLNDMKIECVYGEDHIVFDGNYDFIKVLWEPEDE